MSTSGQRKGAAITWPRPVDHRLDQLAELADEAGEKTNRAELAAAIVCATPANAASLSKMLKDYRTIKARDVVLKAARNSKTLDLHSYGPGPRRPSA